MSRTLIPVVLQFQRVAANSSINVTFDTPAVRWSLGRRLGDSMGFSYNLTPDGVHASTPVLRSVSFNDGILELRTSSIAPTLNDFTFTLFLEVDAGATSLQGYCTLNSEATILAYLGNTQPALWRNGRISAGLDRAAPDFQTVQLTISGLHAGRQLEIQLETDPRYGRATWALGAAQPGNNGVSLRSSAGAAVPLAQWEYTPRQILMRTAGTEGASSDLVLRAYVACVPQDLPLLYLKALGDADITVLAQVGTRQPQWVGGASTLFTL